MGMVVMVLERVPATLRGELTRWMIEPQAGVFVGTMSAMVRDRLWDKAVSGLRGGGAMQLWSTNNEQGFAVRTAGELRCDVVDYQGLHLVRSAHPPERKPDDSAG
jgi:CRISPR-associated protein Cas2